MRFHWSNYHQFSTHLWQMTIVLAVGLAVFGAVYAVPPDTESPVTEGLKELDSSAFMRAKLASSQLVLEGLVTEDFNRIDRGASNMKKMSEAAEWPRSPDKVYDHYSEEFRRLASKLELAAKKSDLDGASFTYTHLTSLCISCHRYVHRSLRVAEDPNEPSAPVRLIPSEWPE